MSEDRRPDTPQAPAGAEAFPPGDGAEPSWAGLVERIRADDPAGMEELYAVFSKGIRFYLWRQVGPQELDDKVHDVFLIIAHAIRRGDLREPERLMGYVRTVVRRQVAAHIEEAVQLRRNQAGIDSGTAVQDSADTPEELAMAQEHDRIAKRILNSIPTRDREILVRFYLREQSAEQICQEMNLTGTQFRLIKSRAKARFGELARRRLSLRSGFRL